MTSMIVQLDARVRLDLDASPPTKHELDEAWTQWQEWHRTTDGRFRDLSRVQASVLASSLVRVQVGGDGGLGARLTEAYFRGWLALSQLELAVAQAVDADAAVMKEHRKRGKLSPPVVRVVEAGCDHRPVCPYCYVIGSQS
jgi:hypothetical protein